MRFKTQLVDSKLGQLSHNIRTDHMETQVGLKMTALTLFLSLFFNFLLQLLCVMISHWLTVLNHKMQRQILFLKAGLVW